MTQPEIEREITVGRHQVRIVIYRALVQLITTRRLYADKGQAKAQAGDHHPPIAAHRVLFRLAPTLTHSLLIGARQGGKRRPIVVQGHALQARTLIKAVQVIADATKQRLDQRGAAVGQLAQRITLLLQSAQDVQGRCGRIQANTIANAPITGRVVSQNQGDTLVLVGQLGQRTPAPRQLGDKIHAFGVWAITDDIRLTALTAPGQVLETDRPGNDAPVQFRQDDVHGQVPSAEPLLARLPAGLVILSANRLQHRNVTAKRP
ncbi:hypothetical protein D3C79_734840 [compost metagenome]